MTIEMDLQSIKLSERSQRKTNTISYIVQSLKKLILTETESRMVVARGSRDRKRGDAVQRIQTSNYKMNKFRGSNIQYGDYS